MKRYGTTPNRLSNATQKRVVYTGNNIKRIGIIIAMAIVMVIVATAIIRDCNQQKNVSAIKSANIEPTVKKHDNKRKQTTHKNAAIPYEAPRDSSPPQTNLNIITD
ncbi:MAG TPA: hypothetical protein P5547_09880 [Spirochaetota bacterium]|nr:hypothetical protein [Spirochaetota bacterium]HPD03703.1 hypothetical protein [Spirochaetota bacterium]HRR61235.1 hypothetical protein [Spirochaetota bacterium]HRV15397.1 hypothetical protein [Spirochaetota bacterium]